MATLAEVLITAGFAFLLGLMAGACIGYIFVHDSTRATATATSLEVRV